MSQKKLREKLHRRAVREQREQEKLKKAKGVNCLDCHDTGEIAEDDWYDGNEIRSGATRPCHCRTKVDEKDDDHD